MSKTNWRKNVKAFTITSILQWFYVPIGVWVLIWRGHLSWEQIAIVSSLGLFAQLALELPSGALADLWGRKNTVLLGRAIGVIGFAILTIADSFWLYALGNILYLSNWAFESGALSALLFDSLKENGVGDKEYQKIQADTFFWCTLGMAASSALGGYVYALHPQLPYAMTTLVALGAFVSALFLEEPRLDSIKVSARVYLHQNWEGFLHIFRNPRVRAVSLFSIAIDFVAYTGLWYLYEPRLSQAGFPAAWLGLLVAGTYLIRAFGTKLIPLAMKLGDTQIPLFLSVFQIVGSALSFIDTKVGAVSSVYLRKMSDGFRYPILDRLQNVELESKYRATSLSAISLLSNILISAAGPVIGYAIERFGTSVALGSFAFVGLFLVLPAGLHLSRQIKNS